MGEVEGTPFGRYRLVELLGRGGMGEVWRAYDPAHDRFVALKVLPSAFADDAVFQERFRREARAAAGLDEPHVVPIHDSGEIDGRLFVSMRLVRGRDLAELLREGALAPERIVGIIEQVASALHAAHEVGLVHRDVKPSNILVGADDFAYLIDFGIARAAGEAGLTSTGSTIGTWAYMAPERFNRGGVADARADTYALTCVLFQGLTGQPPFPAEALEQIAVAHMVEPPPQPARIQAGVPQAMDQVIAIGMAKDPAQRYATTRDLARAARAALDAGPTRPALPHPAPPAPVWDDSLTPTVVEPPPGVGPQPGPVVVPQSTGRRRAMILTALGVTVAAVIGLITIAVTYQHRSRHELPSGTPPTASEYGAQAVLPFTGLNTPKGVAVDGVGAIYVTDTGNNRVLKVAAGSNEQAVLPFTGLDNPRGVAVDGVGAVYITDTGNNRVLKLVAGSSEQTVLPFTGLYYPAGVAVGGDGTVYITDALINQVQVLVGSGEQTQLPFSGLNRPDGVAVDRDGTVYVTDWGNSRVVKMAAGSTDQTVLPFNHYNLPTGVAVDTGGAVYVADPESLRVLKFPAGSGEPTVLPFTVLKSPIGVAVDAGGAVYVTDTDRNRVLKLPRLS